MGSKNDTDKVLFPTGGIQAHFSPLVNFAGAIPAPVPEVESSVSPLELDKAYATVSEVVDRSSDFVKEQVSKIWRQRRKHIPTAAHEVLSILDGNSPSDLLDALGQRFAVEGSEIDTSHAYGVPSSPPPTSILDDTDVANVASESTPIKQKRKASVKRVNRNQVTQQMSKEKIVQNFLKCIDNVLDACNVSPTDDINEARNAIPWDSDSSTPDQRYIETAALKRLATEAATVRYHAGLEDISLSRVLPLVFILAFKIRQGANVNMELAKADPKTFAEHLREVISSGQVYLHLLLSPGAKAELFVHDVVRDLISGTQKILTNFVYPICDNLVVAGDADEDMAEAFGGPKRRKTKSSGAKIIASHDDAKAIIRTTYANSTRLVSKITAEICGVMQSFADLLQRYGLPDTDLVSLSSLAVKPLFVDNVLDVQQMALAMLRVMACRYAEHRGIILDEVFGSLKRLPKTKRNMRTFKLPDGNHIQIITALSINLVEACTYKRDVSRSQNLLPEFRAIAQSFTDAKHLAATLVNQFVVMVGERQEEDSPKLIFETFVDDLLLALNFQQYPAVELLVDVLSKLLIRQMTQKNTKVHVKSIALEKLGLIATKVYQDMGTLTDLESEDGGAKTALTFLKELQMARCTCGRGDIGTEMVECEKCERWFHYACVGYKDTERLQSWLCFRCRRDSAIKSENGNGMDLDDEDEEYRNNIWFNNESELLEKVQATTEEEARLALHALLLDNLCKDNYVSALSRHFLISKWLVEREAKSSGDADEEDQEGMDEEAPVELNSSVEISDDTKKLYLNPHYWYDETIHSFGPPRQATISDNTAQRIMLFLMSQTGVHRNREQLHITLTHFLSDSAALMRTRAMKAITSVMEACPPLLAKEDTRDTLLSTLMDKSTMVRESAVELIGRVVSHHVTHLDQYYDALVRRCKDVGKSVRKKTIKTLRDIAVTHHTHPRVADICFHLSGRLSDEPSIKDLVQETLTMIWFPEVFVGTKKDMPAYAAVGSDSVEDAEILRRARMIVKVVHQYLDQDVPPVWLESYVEGLLDPKASSVSGKQAAQELFQRVVDTMVDYISDLQNLLHVQDNSTQQEEEKVNAVPQQDSEYSRMELVATFCTLDLLSQGEPKLLHRHISVLAPYLIPDSESPIDPRIVMYSAQILGRMVDDLRSRDAAFLKDVEKHLASHIISGKPAVVRACVACLSIIVQEITKNYDLIRKLYTAMYNVLEKHMAQEKKTGKEVKGGAQLKRSLFTVGLIAEKSDLKDLVTAKSKGDDVEKNLLNALVYYAGKRTPDLILKALEALGHVAMRDGQFLLEDRLTQIFERIFKLTQSSNEVITLKRQLLVIIMDVLKNEERKMQAMEVLREKARQDAKALTDAERLRLDIGGYKAADNADSGLSIGLMQRYLGRVLDLLSTANPSLRVNSLQVIQISLRNGLFLPTECIPDLIGLEADEDSKIRDSAAQMVGQIYEKHPDFIPMQLGAGVEKCWFQAQIVQARTSPVSIPTDDTKGDLGSQTEVVDADRVYGYRENPGVMSLMTNTFLMLRRSRQNRRILMDTLLKYFKHKEAAAERSSKKRSKKGSAKGSAKKSNGNANGDEIGDDHFNLHKLRFVAEIVAHFPYHLTEELLYVIHGIDQYVSKASSSLVDHLQAAMIQATDTGATDGSEETLELIASAHSMLLMLSIKFHLVQGYGVPLAKIQAYKPSVKARQFDFPCMKKPEGPMALWTDTVLWTTPLRSDAEGLNMLADLLQKALHENAKYHVEENEEGEDEKEPAPEGDVDVSMQVDADGNLILPANPLDDSMANEDTIPEAAYMDSSFQE
eukprot:Clim_evm15s4 gene=Clim_evmTU15s4